MTPTDKILVVNENANLMWNNHFQHVLKQIASNVWLLSKIRSYLSVEHRLMFYNAHIKPYIEYCMVQ